MEESDAPFFVASGYNVIEDFELDFNSNYVLTDNQTDISQMESIAQSKNCLLYTSPSPRDRG